MLLTLCHRHHDPYLKGFSLRLQYLLNIYLKIKYSRQSLNFIRCKEYCCHHRLHRAHMLHASRPLTGGWSGVTPVTSVSPPSSAPRTIHPPPVSDPRNHPHRGFCGEKSEPKSPLFQSRYTIQRYTVTVALEQLKESGQGYDIQFSWQIFCMIKHIIWKGGCGH